MLVSIDLSPEIFVVATGGTVINENVGGKPYKLHTFTANGSFVVTAPGVVDVEIIGPGGGGSTIEPSGNSFGGGGSAGERKVVSGIAVTAGTYPIVVGLGGVGADYQGGIYQGGDGSAASSAFGNTAAIGRGGGLAPNNGRAGYNGSGAPGDIVARTGGVGSSGRNGGNGIGHATLLNQKGGGGGAGGGAAGSAGTAGRGGAGGAGVSSTFVDTAMSCCGGGGGSGTVTGTGSEGGTHGGGFGRQGTAAGIPAGPGTTPGSAGGGSYGTTTLAGAGFRGVVRVRYRRSA